MKVCSPLADFQPQLPPAQISQKFLALQEFRAVARCEPSLNSAPHFLMPCAPPNWQLSSKKWKRSGQRVTSQIWRCSKIVSNLADTCVDFAALNKITRIPINKVNPCPKFFHN